MTFPVSKLLLASSAFLILAACSGGGGGDDPAPNSGPDITDNQYIADSSVRMRNVEASDNCPNGGVLIEMGIDSNGNGLLDDTEIDASRTEEVCHGVDLTESGGTLISVKDAPVSECPDGGKIVSIGQDLNDDKLLTEAEVSQTESLCNAIITKAGGLSSLVTTTVESVGEHCPTGGIKVEAGLDSNDDKTLSEGEIQSTNYVCNGVDGADGQNGTNGVDGTNGTDGQNGADGADGNDGVDGQDGANGVDGTNGADGKDGVDGADGRVSGLENLLIETIDEQPGNNCLHGGYKNLIGLDADQDDTLSEAEVVSFSFICYENNKPVIGPDTPLQAAAGGKYQFDINSSDYDGYINAEGEYVYDQTVLSIVEKPEWLEVRRLSDSGFQLSGIAPEEAGTTVVIKATATDGELVTNRDFTLEIKDGIAVELSADTVVEGDDRSQTANFTVHLSKPATQALQLSYQLSSQNSNNPSDWSVAETSGILVFAPGEQTKQIPVTVMGDQDFELKEQVQLRVNVDDYNGPEWLVNPETVVMDIGNDDALRFYAEQDNLIPVLISGGVNITLQNQPSWLSSEYQYTQYGARQVMVVGQPPSTAIGTSGVFDVRLSAYPEATTETVNYVVVEGDRDLDGVANSADRFPDNAAASVDADNDGLGDEWELRNFESLSGADASSDYDANGVTDLQAFENGTPINDLNVSFESGTLPDDWVNTGDVAWVVSDTNSYDGQYALTLAEALEPGQTASISFPVNVQAGTLAMYRYHETSDDYNEGFWRITSSKGGSDYTYSYYYGHGRWLDDQHLELVPGEQIITLSYTNDYGTSPRLYVDAISGLIGVVPADRDGDGVLNSQDAFPDNALGAVDSDNDGLADEWEMQYVDGLTDLTASSDYDGDGLADLDEFLSSADPTNTDSDYDGADDGADFAPIDNRYQTDTDNDGLADNWEQQYFGSLTVSDGSQDSDNDSVSDATEYANGTMPAIDTDSDGVVDINDVYPTDARYQADSDGDGIADKWKSEYWRSPLYCSFSATRDCDNDGRLDLQEFLEGTDPTVVDLTAKEDIITVVKGQTVLFDPTVNDLSIQPAISAVINDLPTSGTLQDNQDGSYSYTATNDRLGWLRLSYTANDGVSSDSGDIFIHIVESALARLQKLESSDYSRYGFSVALFDDGTVYSWGDNSQGQLGIENPIDNVPSIITGLPAIRDIALGRDYVFALAENGTVWTWGDGSVTPSQVAGLAGVTGIAAYSGEEYSFSFAGFAIQADKTVVTISSSQTVTTLAGLSDITQISAGYGHLLALDDSGDVWSYGPNPHSWEDYGRLGNVDNDGSTPMKVSKISGIATIKAGHYQSFAISNSGQLYAWGYNGSGQLGDGTSTHRTVPVLIEGVSDVQAVDTSSAHTLVLNATGQLYGMGSDNNNQLFGQGSSRVPVLLTDDTVRIFAAGERSSFIETSQGETFGIGDNGNGQLGNGTQTSASEPTPIAWLSDGVISELGKEGFEWGRLPPYWRNSGNNWELVNEDVSSGDYAMRTKPRLNDNDNASLGLQITTGTGPVTFRYKTSTEQEWDKLTFYIDGVAQQSFSGETLWNTSTAINVAAGVHRFEWVYSKDGGTSEGSDTVWLDDIMLPVDTDADGVIDTADADPYSALIQ